MPAHIFSQTPSRRPSQPELLGLVAASGPRPEAILLLLAIALLLMSGPALLAILSIADSDLLGTAQGWAKEAFSWLSFLTPARLVVALPLAAMIARAKEDS